MDEEPNPIKDILYETIDEIDENKIKENISKGKSAEIINNIILISQEKITKLEGSHEINTAKLLTSLLHYLLSLVLIPSQRKIVVNEIDVDIVIPDLKTLKTKPEESILICIPEIHEIELEKQIQLMDELQLVKENIWYVTEKDLNKKTYSIKSKTILKIIEDINEFLSSKKTTQFRFFKA